MDIENVKSSAERANVVLGYVFAKDEMSPDTMIWIYPGGEGDVLEACINSRLDCLKRWNKNRIVLITCDGSVKLDNEMLVETISIEDMDAILKWYVLCNPSPRVYCVISLIHPRGREGNRWINGMDRVDLKNACRVGILKLPNA